jgi:GDP-D-mannose dehydratase
MRRTALLTGIAGMDGSYVAELILEKDHVVHGPIRPARRSRARRIDHRRQDSRDPNARRFLHYAHLTGALHLITLLARSQRDEAPFYTRSPYGTEKVQNHWIFRLAHKPSRLLRRCLIGNGDFLRLTGSEPKAVF